MKKIIFYCIVIAALIWNFVLDSDDVDEIKKEVGKVLIEVSETTQVKLKEARKSEPKTELKSQKEQGKEVMDTWSGKGEVEQKRVEEEEEKSLNILEKDFKEAENELEKKGGTERKAL